LRASTWQGCSVTLPWQGCSITLPWQGSGGTQWLTIFIVIYEILPIIADYRL
jgi:hypothetical protein